MKCPGQDTRYWKPGDIFEISCPECGHEIEFFKDEATRRCRACGKVTVNPKMDFGCAAYCKYASECLGELGPELIVKRDDLLKDRVAVEVKRRLGQDFRRISHGMRVARFSEEIAGEEKADLAVLRCSAYLHLLLERESDNEVAGIARKEAREILTRLGARRELAEKVEATIDDFMAGRRGRLKEADVLSDAHLLAFMDETKDRIGYRNEKEVEERCSTGTGRKLARRLLGDDSG